MDPRTPRGGSSAPRGRGKNPRRAEVRPDEGSHQPDMSVPPSAPAALPEESEPSHWLVPDTGDDIVVSRVWAEGR